MDRIDAEKKRALLFQAPYPKNSDTPPVSLVQHNPLTQSNGYSEFLYPFLEAQDITVKSKAMYRRALTPFFNYLIHILNEILQSLRSFRMTASITKWHCHPDRDLLKTRRKRDLIQVAPRIVRFFTTVHPLLT